MRVRTTVNGPSFFLLLVFAKDLHHSVYKTVLVIGSFFFFLFHSLCDFQLEELNLCLHVFFSWHVYFYFGWLVQKMSSITIVCLLYSCLVLPVS